MYHIFPHYVINGMTEKEKVIEHNMLVSIFSTNYLKHFPFQGKMSGILS